jgi:hypothetical protein
MDCIILRSPVNKPTQNGVSKMSHLEYSEQNPMETLEAAETHALRLQNPEKLVKACATAQELVPEGTVVSNCGMVSLTLLPTRGGFGRIQVVINSFLGPISSVNFFGEWVRLAFPPAAGVFNNTNTKVFNLGSSNVVLVSTFAPGRFKVFANLTFLQAITPENPCIGLLPSDLKQF